MLMDKMGIKKAVIMGLSMGGYISIDFTLTHPEKVFALIPVSSGLTGYEVVDKQYMELLTKWKDVKTIEEGVELLQQYLTDGPYRKPEQVNPEVREKIKQMYTENILANTNLAFKEVRTDPPAIKRLFEIKVPTLTIYGDLDGPYIFEIADMIIKDVKGAKKYIIKDAAHYVNMEKPEEFNRTVISFINTLKDK
jgi:3-oxoadipate enol-lactonase